MAKVSVDHAHLEQNLSMQKGLIAAEPLYILLASLGHPDAHEKVRNLTLTAQKEGKSLEDVAFADSEMKPYLDKMTDKQKSILKNPSSYIGISAKKSKQITEHWRKRMT